MSSGDTLTRRVTWALTATVALFVGLMAALAFSVMFEQEDELADQLVLIEMQRVMTRLELGELSLTTQPIELGLRLHAWVGESATASLPIELHGLSVGPHEIETADQVLHALITDSPQGRVVVVFDATANEQRVTQFGLILLALWVFCTISGYWLARMIARIVVGPMRDVTERIAGWDPGVRQNSGSRVHDNSEAGRLIEAFNRMQDRVDASIAREREFAANLSHEIRTPLAALRTDVEMAAFDERLTSEQRQRFDRITRAVDDIGAMIVAARAISQAQAAPRQPLHVAYLIDDAWNGMRERGSAAGLVFVNRVTAGLVITADRHALLIVVRNLVRNAIEHAAPATLRVCASDHSLQFEDDGPGISDDKLPFLFDRHYHSRLKDRGDTPPVADAEEEHGLGLAIARRVCEQQGWHLSVQSSRTEPGRGTRFTLQFDENSTTP
jgi:signal transduction histidine kinase